MPDGASDKRNCVHDHSISTPAKYVLDANLFVVAAFDFIYSCGLGQGPKTKPNLSVG